MLNFNRKMSRRRSKSPRHPANAGLKARPNVPRPNSRTPVDWPLVIRASPAWRPRGPWVG